MIGDIAGILRVCVFVMRFLLLLTYAVVSVLFLCACLQQSSANEKAGNTAKDAKPKKEEKEKKEEKKRAEDGGKKKDDKEKKEEKSKEKAKKGKESQEDEKAKEKITDEGRPSYKACIQAYIMQKSFLL